MRLAGHTGIVNSCAVDAPEPNLMVSGGDDGETKVGIHLYLFYITTSTALGPQSTPLCRFVHQQVSGNSSYCDHSNALSLSVLVSPSFSLCWSDFVCCI